VPLTTDEKLREPQAHRSDLIHIGKWTIAEYQPMEAIYIYHHCRSENSQPHLVSYMFTCPRCDEAVPDEIQALYLMLEDGNGFVKEQ